MIYGRIWLVVKPTLGVPLLLGAVAVSSFAVHAALLTNTTWLKKYLNGNAAAATVLESPTKVSVVSPPTAKT